MSLCRNTEGKLAYLAKTPNGVFSIIRGDNIIYSHRKAYEKDRALLGRNLLLGLSIPRFDTFYQAVKFFKENMEEIV